MGKRQPLDAPPDRRDEELQRSDVPSIGTLAPPIDPDTVPGLMLEKPKLKRKNRPLLPSIIIALIVALVVLGAMSTVIVKRESSNAVVVIGDGRIEPPTTLPDDITLKGTLSEKWQPASVSPLAWDTWSITAKAGDTFTVLVNPINPDFTPILGLYDSDGKLVVAAPADRTAPQKALKFTFKAARTYTVLVSNIGGAAGSYEIRSQLER